MQNENDCQCVICNVETALLGSFSTQTARNHFKTFTSNYPVLSHLTSPIDLVTHLHEQGEAVDHGAGKGILHTLIHTVSTRGAFENLGQQLLLVAFTPAIHRACREICQRFSTVAREDVSQQAWMILLETAKFPPMLQQNGHLPVALVTGKTGSGKNCCFILFSACRFLNQTWGNSAKLGP